MVVGTENGARRRDFHGVSLPALLSLDDFKRKKSPGHETVNVARKEGMLMQ